MENSVSLSPASSMSVGNTLASISDFSVSFTQTGKPEVDELLSDIAVYSNGGDAMQIALWKALSRLRESKEHERHIDPKTKKSYRSFARFAIDYVNGLSQKRDGGTRSEAAIYSMADAGSVISKYPAAAEMGATYEKLHYIASKVKPEAYSMVITPSLMEKKQKDFRQAVDELSQNPVIGKVSTRTKTTKVTNSDGYLAVFRKSSYSGLDDEWSSSARVLLRDEYDSIKHEMTTFTGTVNELLKIKLPESQMLVRVNRVHKKGVDILYYGEVDGRLITFAYFFTPETTAEHGERIRLESMTQEERDAEAELEVEITQYYRIVAERLRTVAEGTPEYIVYEQALYAASVKFDVSVQRVKKLVEWID